MTCRGTEPFAFAQGFGEPPQPWRRWSGSAAAGGPGGPSLRRNDGATEAIVLGWSVNELTASARATLFAALRAASTNGAAVLVIEPLARAAAPWWDDWARVAIDAGGRADEWKLSVDLPPRLRDLDAGAGFRREHLGARTLLFPIASSRGGRAESAADRRE